MVVATQASQVRWLGLAAVGPVVNMVGVYVACIGAAAGETTALVAGVEGATQGW